MYAELRFLYCLHLYLLKNTVYNMILNCIKVHPWLLLIMLFALGIAIFSAWTKNRFIREMYIISPSDVPPSLLAVVTIATTTYLSPLQCSLQILSYRSINIFQ